jgi:hypothetical protein
MGWQDDARVTGFVEPAIAGNWRIERFTVGRADASAQAFRALISGRGVTTPGEYTRLMRGGRVVMSDTPDELRDMSEIVWRATGRVLVHGLGLGCVVKALLAKSTVTHIDVMEVDSDVISLVGRYYAGQRCTIHQGDCLAFRWAPGIRWDCVWHDIWTDLCTDDLAEHTKLLRKFGHRCDWQGCWGHAYLKRRCG